ncbi:50S ribosomal protein L4 [Candidatus Saccharibacteria bacterium]|nr:50S ribosomal protein L4 [Candidatus Saccharibacteria bacterium]MBI3338139.1 50S ribosomal protein L4 [Candidatus Saccharibacteria bacterium]
MAISTYTKTGNKATISAKLDKTVFGIVPENHELLKQAYVAYLSNGRENAAQTKSRGEVSGGGKKPWKQKGTGRARFGSSRNPIWRGGGVAFGPTGNENYTHKLHVNAKRRAIRQALSLKADSDAIKIIETFDCKDGKVKSTLKLIDKIEAKGKILLVVSVKDNLVERATSNIPDLKAIQAKYLNVYDVMNADSIIMSQKSLDIVHEWLGVNHER